MQIKVEYILNSFFFSFFNANDYFCRNICSLLARFECITRNHRQKYRFAFTSSSISRAFYPSSFAISLERGSYDPWESQTRANAKTYSASPIQTELEDRSW